MAEEVFPRWVFERLEQYQSNDCDPVLQFIAEYSELSGILRQYPKDATFFEVREVSPSAAASVFGDPLTGLVCSAEAASMAWVFSNIFKLRAYFDGFETMMRSGNLLVAASCARGIFEQVACFNYYFIRVSRNRDKLEQLVNMERKRIRKGIVPSDSWKNKVNERVIKHIQICFRAFQGSDFDWQKFLEKQDSALYKDLSKYQGLARGDIKKLHINDAIKSLPGNSNLTWDLYSALCDFVHPNIGSHYLIMDIRNSKDDETFYTTLTDIPVNHDAVVLFMTVVSVALSPVLRVAKEQISRSVSITNEYQSWAITTQKYEETTN